MKRKMGIRAAWLWLAKQWDEAIVMKHGGAYLLIDNCPCLGLCHCIDFIEDSLVSESTAIKMREMVSRFEPKTKSFTMSGYFWPRDSQGAKARARFCRRMAAKCERKAKKWWDKESKKGGRR